MIERILEDLVAIPSPTGYTKNIMDWLYQKLSETPFEVSLTPKGQVHVILPGKNQDQHRAITAHLDTLGAIVRAIKPDGRLKMDKLGGYPWNMIEGENCLIHPALGGPALSGTILIHQTSTHVYRDAGTAERTQDNMEIRLDAKTQSAQETKDLGIQVGDFISFDPRFTITDTGFVKSRFLDDKVSAAILIDFILNWAKTDHQLPVTTHFLFSAYEEVGFGANSDLDPRLVEFLALDMGAMGDDQATDEYTVSICVKDASGPYHLGLRNHLVGLCQKNKIPYKLDIYPYYGSDASSAMRAGANVKHGLFGAGIESSHSYERTHRDSIQATASLVKAYLLSDLVVD